MEMRGPIVGDWLKLHRKLRGHPIMSQDGLCRLWMHCMLEANWKDSTWLIPGTGRAIEIKRGAFITGRAALHKQLYGSVDHREIEKPSESTLWRRLQTLQQLGSVKLENVDNRCTMVTLCNYELYQSSEESIRTTDEQPVNNQRTTDEQPVNTDKEEKKIEGKKEENTGGEPPVGPKPEPPKPPKPRAKAAEVTADGINYPECLDTPEVRQAVAEWLEHKRGKGEKYKTITSANAIFKNGDWQALGAAGFVYAVNHSIGANWSGIFPPKGKAATGPANDPRGTYAAANEYLRQQHGIEDGI